MQNPEATRMLVVKRRELLLARLRSEGKLIAKDLARELGVSEDSVRRDLRDLAQAGLCRRVYGGAVPVAPAAVDYRSRTVVETESKQRVARRAARLIEPGHRVILDGGTTTLAVVQALAPDLSATVITHSPTIAGELVDDHDGIEVFLLGGRLFKHSAVTCGAAAAEMAQSISADLFFLGVTGVHPVHGLTTGDPEDAAMKRLLAGRAAEAYVLASREKIGAASAYGVLPLEQVTAVIADASVEDPVIQQVADAGTRVILASS